MITSPWELAAPGIVTGDTNHFIVPQSKLNVSVCAGLMCDTGPHSSVKARTWAVSARSTGSRSIDEAPKKPQTPVVRSRT
jgi:hypothetical protein